MIWPGLPPASASLLLLLSCCMLFLVVNAQHTTHRCSLHIDLSPEAPKFSLSCHQAPTAAAGCKLVIYYNSTGPFNNVDFATPAAIIKPPFQGVSAGVLRPPPPWGAADFASKEGTLNRTEVLHNSMIWPILYFHGGPACSVLLESPYIHGVKPGLDNADSAVLMFGGGLSATMLGGKVVHSLSDLGIVVLSGTALRINNTQFYKNTVSKGTVYASWNSTIHLNNVSFREHEATEGAAMYVVGSKGSTISGCMFENNIAWAAGGAMYIKYSSVNFSSTEFNRNSAPVGGALAVYDSSRVAFWEQCRLDGNVARLQTKSKKEVGNNYYNLGVGGAMYMEDSSVTIVDSIVSNNRAVMNGGAIQVQRGDLSIADSEVSGNTAHRNGGALKVDTSDEVKDDQGNTKPSNLWLTNVIMRKNLAEANGGCIDLKRWSHTHVNSTLFEDCQAWNSGGGICTEMAADDKDDREQDLKTTLDLERVVFNGTTENSKLFIGPYFNLKIAPHALQRTLNASSTGVTWNRRLCFKGEFVADRQYCDKCPPYQWSTLVGTPGHRAKNCSRAPTWAHAPGGAVLVPMSGGWHVIPETDIPKDVIDWNQFNQSTRRCTDCAPLVATLDNVRRCPNPAACSHNVTFLAEHHPDSNNADIMSWATYSRQLCNHREGYEGILCGVCSRGFGQTAPFRCNRCIGFNALVAHGGSRAGVQQPGPARISGLYFVYWLVLTCWLLLCVRFSSVAPSQKHDRKHAVSPPTAAQAVLQECTVERSWKNASNIAPGIDTSSAPDQQQHQQHQQYGSNRLGQVTSAAAAQPRRHQTSKSLDITKTLVAYVQWVMLIINLPVSWMPWATPSNGSTTAAVSHSFSDFVGWLLGIAFGRSASLDCYLQANDILQADHKRDIISNVFARALGSAVIVPTVLFLSVLTLQLLFYVLKRPLHRAIDKLCARSELLQRHIGIRLSSTQSSQPSVFADRGKSSEADSALNLQSCAMSNNSTTSSELSFMRENLLGKGVDAAGFGKRIRNNAIATALAASLFVYITICKVAVGMLMCVKGVGNSDRWVMDVRLECPVTNLEKGWALGATIVGAALVCACIAWPVGIAWVLAGECYHNRLLRVDASKRVASASASGAAPQEITHNWVVRYADYDVDYDALSKSANEGQARFEWLDLWRPGYWHAAALKMRTYAVLCWDSILELHRLTIAVMSLCVMLHELHQLILLVVALTSYLLLVLLVKPWRATTVWRLQVLALSILVFSCLGIMACTVGDASAYYSEDMQRTYVKSIPWVVLLVNLAYLVLVLGLLLRCLIREVPRLEDIKDHLYNRWQKLKFAQRFGRPPAAPAGTV